MNFNSLISRRRGSIAEVDFVSIFRTTTASETITLPTPTNYEVDWGDGTITTDANSHVYAIDGDYEIKIKGNITDWRFSNSGDKDKILLVSNWGDFNLISNAFFGCSNLDVTATDSPKIISLNNAFRGCLSLIANISILNWDLTTMDGNCFGAFFQVTNLDQNISILDWSNTINLSFFLTGGLSPTNYDNLLIKWDNQLVFSGFSSPNISTSSLIKYTSFGAAARASLVSKGFVITDGGQV